MPGNILGVGPPRFASFQICKIYYFLTYLLKFIRITKFLLLKKRKKRSLKTDFEKNVQSSSGRFTYCFFSPRMIKSNQRSDNFAGSFIGTRISSSIALFKAFRNLNGSSPYLVRYKFFFLSLCGQAMKSLLGGLAITCIAVIRDPNERQETKSRLLLFWQS